MRNDVKNGISLPIQFGRWNRRMESIYDYRQMKKQSSLFIPVALVLTLGLAPYIPEPHIWGKIKWVLGGAVGMRPMDWF